MDELMKILAEMGATNIEFASERFCDESLNFTYKEKTAALSGQWHNDGTGGLSTQITSSK